jgi:hypothetical protein
MTGTWDASGALATKPMKAGSSLPSACATGEAFFKTDASAGQNLYLCKPENTWTQVTSGGGSSTATSKELTFDGATTLTGETMAAWSCGSGSGAQCTTTWTVPGGVGAVRVRGWSGGGGGGGSTAGDRAGNGGAGGGYWEATCPVSAGGTVAIAVGLGGAGSAHAYATGGAGGNTSFGSCFTVLGGGGGSGSTGTPWGGRLAGSSVVGWAVPDSGLLENPTLSYCSSQGSDGGVAIRQDGGGCGGGGTWNSGSTGYRGGAALSGGGGGGGGSYNTDTVGGGGNSAAGNLLYTDGGNGGNGGAWTSGTGLTACGAGHAPGGGGGAAGAMTSGANQTGCGGGRGEIRVYYTR